MNYLTFLFAPAFATTMLIALPALTLMLMRRAGIRGWKLSLSLVPAVCLFLGGYVSYWFLASDLALQLSRNGLVAVVIAKSLGVFISAISPLLILAILKWPVLDNSGPHVEPFK
jgi:hypothetical protein